MSEVAYPACIRALYESEIFGEASFLALIKIATNERDGYQFGTLLQLETETKARLRPFLSNHGIDLSESMDLGDVAGVVAACEQQDWQEFTGAIIPIVSDFLERSKEIAAAGPAS